MHIAMWQTLRPLLVTAAGLVFLTYLGYFLTRLYHWRKLCHRLPGPPHSLFFGHIPILIATMAKLPRSIAPQAAFESVKRKYNLGDIYYMDMFPLGPALLVSTDPRISDQFVVKPSLPKHPVVADFSAPLGGRENMVAVDGPEWKVWRSAFNPGFATSHLMTVMPDIVDHVSTFCQILKRRAKGEELFRLERHATRLTIDIIGRVVLDTHFNSQLTENEVVSAFESQVELLPIGVVARPSEAYNLFRPITQRWNTWKMDKYLNRAIEERFASLHQRGKSKHVIDLALEAYLKQQGKSIDDLHVLDKSFKQRAINNVKIFIFAGHDTSSSVICYCYYYLSKHPSVLRDLRKECDELFGPDPNQAGERLKSNPYLLNKIIWGDAIVKETLRLQPPASSIRLGNKDCLIRDPENNQVYPTDGFLCWQHNVGTHRNARIWGQDADEFVPARWLRKDDAACRDAFVGFSKSIRNCIGQELAMLEIKMVLAMTVRSFDFKPAYDELDKLRGDNSGYKSDTTGIQEHFGDEAYQIQVGTAKPREGMPCRVSLRTVGQD